MHIISRVCKENTMMIRGFHTNSSRDIIYCMKDSCLIIPSWLHESNNFALFYDNKYEQSTLAPVEIMYLVFKWMLSSCYITHWQSMLPFKFYFMTKYKSN